MDALLQAMTQDERYFDPIPGQKELALRLYRDIAALPIVSPHTHVDAHLFAEDAPAPPSPVDFFVLSDHYLLRMLYSQGIPLEDLGVQPRLPTGRPVELDPRRAWQRFAEAFFLFRATPSGLWLGDELRYVFGEPEPPNAGNAQELYDRLSARLASPDYSPRRLYERFGLEVLCTTDSATGPLEAHRDLRTSAWQGRILPTFRPDDVIDPALPGWSERLERLGELTGMHVASFRSLVEALGIRRQSFKELGATATDQAMLVPYTCDFDPAEAEQLFQRALHSGLDEREQQRFGGMLLMESARLSLDDGLVMQLHVGSYRNHNRWLFEHFGPDRGADIPLQVEFTRNLLPLLNRYGNDPRLRLILFTLDNFAYSRELAPLAGHYPALKLGPPWWFQDSLNGMRRYFDQVIDTAGLFNTVGFNDDARSLASIPVRHDLWRRASCNWLAGLVVRHIVSEEEAAEMAHAMAYDLAKASYMV